MSYSRVSFPWAELRGGHLGKSFFVEGVSRGSDLSRGSRGAQTWGKAFSGLSGRVQVPGVRSGFLEGVEGGGFAVTDFWSRRLRGDKADSR
jgi:hypothetical protein